MGKFVDSEGYGDDRCHYGHPNNSMNALDMSVIINK